MQNPGSMNIFSNDSSDNLRTQAIRMFSLVDNQNHQNQQNRESSNIHSKRQSFRNQIRLQYIEKRKKNCREELKKLVQSNKMVEMLEELAEKGSQDSAKLIEILWNIQNNFQELDFSQKISQNKLVKQFLTKRYCDNQSNLTITEKTLILQCLTFLTYYSQNLFSIEQKLTFAQKIIKQIQDLSVFQAGNMAYIKAMINILINFTSDKNIDFNLFLMDTRILKSITDKITELSMEGSKLQSQGKDKDLQELYLEEMTDTRFCYVELVQNLADKNSPNMSFFHFVVNQFICDNGYVLERAPIVFKILTEFLKVDELRYKFMENEKYFMWFEESLIPFSQKRFSNKDSISTGNFDDIIMTDEEKETFHLFLRCVLTWIEYENQQAYLQCLNIMIMENLNAYCLSEFLIQSAAINSEDKNAFKRNSNYVAKAIQMYQYLADNNKIGINELLIVTSGREFEDILKVFLDETYFTSIKVSEVTLSLLNKMISKDPKIINSLIELGIFDSIEKFVEQEIRTQKKKQIVNFIELLTLLVASYYDIAKGKNPKNNQISRQLEIRGIIQKVERYADQLNNNDMGKLEAFLNYFETTSTTNQNFQQIEI